MELNFEQPVNTSIPILVTLLGMFIEVNVEHLKKAPSGILVTLLVGINVTEVKLVHWLNDLLSILVTLLPKTIEVSLSFSIKNGVVMVELLYVPSPFDV